MQSALLCVLNLPFFGDSLFITLLYSKRRAYRTGWRGLSLCRLTGPTFYMWVFHVWLVCALLTVVQDFAKYLDWFERHGIYQEASEGRDRIKSKEVRLTIRRYGLEERQITPSPDQFLIIQSRGSLTWTDTHQWLILLRFFDILADLRGVPSSATGRVGPSPARLSSLTQVLSSVSQLVSDFMISSHNSSPGFLCDLIGKLQ